MRNLVRFALPLGLLLCLAAAVSSDAAPGPVFDDALNYAVVDQTCPPVDPAQEGLVLVAQGKAQWVQLSSKSPVGQTFTLSDRARRLWRIFVGISHWPDSWQEGEAVTFTLYDSPEKRTKLYSRTLDFDHKWSKWDTAFDVDIEAAPGQSFYFELTHNGGGDDRVNVTAVSGNVYPRGSARIGGVEQPDLDLTFTVTAKPQPDREANLRRFIGRFDLQHPLLEKARQAYDAGDLDRTCIEILRAVEAHLRKADWIPWLKPGEKPDVSRMEKVVSEGRLYSTREDGEGSWIEMSRQTTWREVWPGSASYVRHNDLFADLGRAYAATKDERYARKLNELMLDFVQDHASPFEGGMRGGRWVAMFQAWRLGDAWDGFALAMGSTGLTDDVKLAWLDYNARMAHFALTEPSGGNHANAVAEALMKFAERFPMYAESKVWFSRGFELLVNNSLKLFWPDGGCVEPAMNYHGFSLANLMAGLETAGRFGLDAPPDLMRVVEAAHAYTAYMLKPDGQIPTYGDTDCEDFRPGIQKWQGWRNGEAMTGAKLFNRKDLLFIATAGREGERPAEDSYCFPDTGHYILRSGWGGPGGTGFEDERWLFLRAGRFGSHGHDDLNMVTLYAYGRPLLIDPGRTEYGTELMFELTRNRSHNVLLVDDLMMQHPAPRLNAWVTSPVIDFVDNSYAELYPGVEHRRAVVFVRPDYYVLFDGASGDKEHNYGLNFWLTPPDAAIDPARGTVRSTTPDAANVLVQSADAGKIRLASRKGTLDLRGIRDDIPVVTFWRDGVKAARFATILYPFPAGKTVELLDVRDLPAPGEERVLRIATPSGVDYVGYDPAGGEEGPSAWVVRSARDGRTVRAFGVAGARKLDLQGRVLASADKALKGLSVEYGRDTVTVSLRQLEPSLRVATLGRRKAVVNGREMSVSGATFAPFAAK
ncbi:MAG: heparinase II/III family protein [Armatimonadota bacterium]